MAAISENFGKSNAILAFIKANENNVADRHADACICAYSDSIVRSNQSLAERLASVPGIDAELACRIALDSYVSGAPDMLHPGSACRYY